MRPGDIIGLETQSDGSVIVTRFDLEGVFVDTLPYPNAEYCQQIYIGTRPTHKKERVSDPVMIDQLWRQAGFFRPRNEYYK